MVPSFFVSSKKASRLMKNRRLALPVWSFTHEKPSSGLLSLLFGMFVLQIGVDGEVEVGGHRQR